MRNVNNFVTSYYLLKQIDMKKVLLLVLMGLMLMPMEMFADHYNSDKLYPHQEPPVRTPYFINAEIDSETGAFLILANYDIACLYVTIEQNNVVLDSFSQPLYNGVPATYNFAGYSSGEYIVTLSTVDGMIAQYRVAVVED